MISLEFEDTKIQGILSDFIMAIPDHALQELSQMKVHLKSYNSEFNYMIDDSIEIITKISEIQENLSHETVVHLNTAKLILSFRKEFEQFSTINSKNFKLLIDQANQEVNILIYRF